MIRSKLWLASFALICVGLASVVQADATMMRCGDRIAQVGDTAYDVHALCGDPDWVQQTMEARTVARPAVVPCRVGYGVGRCTVYVQDTVQVPVEEWTYDFGPNQFIEYVTFEQGRLVHIRSGAYGHKQQF